MENPKKLIKGVTLATLMVGGNALADAEDGKYPLVSYKQRETPEQLLNDLRKEGKMNAFLSQWAITGATREQVIESVKNGVVTDCDALYPDEVTVLTYTSEGVPNGEKTRACYNKDKVENELILSMDLDGIQYDTSTACGNLTIHPTPPPVKPTTPPVEPTPPPEEDGYTVGGYKDCRTQGVTNIGTNVEFGGYEGPMDKHTWSSGNERPRISTTYSHTIDDGIRCRPMTK